MKDDRFAYLSLLMDVATRYIVGHQLHHDLSRRGTLEALRKSLKLYKPLQAVLQQPLIHHTDRGSQYCCYEYQEELKKNGVNVSMTESGDPRDNGKAERLNGTLKNEFLDDVLFDNIEEARKAVNLAVKIYNTERPHQNLGYQTPECVFQQQIKNITNRNV